MQISKKLPLPGIIRIFIFWLLFLAISLGATFLYALTSGGLSLLTTVMLFSGTCLAIIPIGDFYNRSQRAIVSSKLASMVFSLLMCIGSFTVISRTGSIIIASENPSDSMIISQDFVWLLGMWLIFTSALLLSFFFYVQNSLEVKKSLNLTTELKASALLPLGNLAVISLISIFLSLRFILGIAFFSEENNSDSLPFALLITVPHILMAVSMIRSYAQKTIDISIYSKLGIWLIITLIMMASRNYILGLYSNSLPTYLISIFSIFLYVLPNTLVVALPLIWWALRKQETKNSLAEGSAPSFIDHLLDFPLPLIIGLLYVGFQGVLFVCNGASTQLVSFNVVSSELQNSIPDIYAAEQSNSIFFFGIGMFLFSCVCILTTRKNPYHGIKLCRIFCMLAAIAHALLFINILTKNPMFIISSQLLLSEAALYCFTSIAGYAAFSVMQAILLLPHEGKEQNIPSEPVTERETMRLEDEVIQENNNTTIHNYKDEVIPKNTDYNAISNKAENNALLNSIETGILLKGSHDKSSEQDIERKSNAYQQEETPYLDKVRPQLPKWLLLFIPQKGQPLPLFLFSLFCFAIIAKWFFPLFVQSFVFFTSSVENTYLIAQNLFKLSLLLVSIPLLGIHFGRQNMRIKIFMLYLSFSLIFIIFFGSYAIIPGFSLLTPEAVGVIAMLWYCKSSTVCHSWFKKENTSLYIR